MIVGVSIKTFISPFILLWEVMAQPKLEIFGHEEPPSRFQRACEELRSLDEDDLELARNVLLDENKLQATLGYTDRKRREKLQEELEKLEISAKTELIIGFFQDTLKGVGKYNLRQAYIEEDLEKMGFDEDRQEKLSSDISSERKYVRRMLKQLSSISTTRQLNDVLWMVSVNQDTPLIREMKEHSIKMVLVLSGDEEGAVQFEMDASQFSQLAKAVDEIRERVDPDINPEQINPNDERKEYS